VDVAALWRALAATVVSLVPEDDNAAETARGVRAGTALPCPQAPRRLRLPSHRWSDPRACLLAGKGWEAVRGDVQAGLSLDENAEQHLKELTEVLDALLNLDGGVKPEMVATDNASYSDMVFGIFKMLGYRD